MKNSTGVLASAVMTMCAGVASAAVTYQDAAFDWSKTPDNTAPQNAADWFGANWNVATPPNGSAWNVSLKNATGYRYVNVTAPVTVGKLNGTYSGSNISILTGDSTLTLDLEPAGGRVYSGEFMSYAPITWTGEWGVMGGATVLRGPFSGDELTVAGRFYHYMAFSAVDSSERIVQPFSLNLLYQGGSDIVLTSPRGCSHEQSVTFRVTNGSRFAAMVSTPAGFVPVCGAKVTSAAFPEGTFVKRNFDGTVFELSAAASTDGDVAATLSKFEPEVHVRIPVYQRASYDRNTFSLDLYADVKGYRFEVDAFTANKASKDGQSVNEYLVLQTSDANSRAGTFVVHDATKANIDLELVRANLEFAENGMGVSGFPLGTFRSKNATDTATVTVTNGIYAVMPNFEEWRGMLVKNGAGTLDLGLTNAVEKYTGSVVVEAGTAILPEGAWISTLAVSNGATVRVDGTLEPENLFVQPGARVDGAGTLVLSDMETVSKLVCSPSVTVRIRGGGDKPLLEQPEAKVVGTPAFWVDVQAASSLTFKDGDGVNVTRIDDCRKVDDPSGDYLFATNVVNAPTLVKDGQQKPSHIYFGALNGGSDITVLRELVWSRSITNMKAIFIVQNNYGGGGQFLGSTVRLKSELGGRPSDFVRPAYAGSADPVFHTGNSGVYQLAAMNGAFYQNGHLTDYTKGYLYDTSRTIGDYGQTYVPVVCELYPTLPLAADCFAFDSGAGGRNGVKRLCEMIVYTNELSSAERVQVAGYLMKKWINCDVDYETVPAKNLGAVDLASAPRLETAADETLVAASVSGAGTLAKFGAGTLYVDALRDASADIEVTGGKLQVRSAVIPTADDLPADPYFRVDASNPDSLTFASGSDVNVATWKSSSGDLTWQHWGVDPAVLKPDRLNGRAMIDFGPAKIGSNGAYFYFPQNDRLQSLFFVENTAAGGATVIGSRDSYSKCGIVRGNWYERYNKSQDPDFSKDDPLVSLSYGGGLGSRGARVRLNGTAVDPTTTGFSGGNDLVSLVSYVNISSDAFGYNTGHTSFANGGMLGEYVAYARGLSSRDALKVEAYLRKKWFGQDTAEFLPAVAGRVAVASGASLEVVGDGPLTLASLAGGGTVSGSVTFASGADFTLVAQSDGTMGKAASVSGTLDLSVGGVVKVTGSVLALPSGVYTVVEAGTLTGSLDNWSVDLGTAGKRRTAALSMDGTRVLLTIGRFGSVLIVR